MINKIKEIFRLRRPDELSQQETEFLPAVLEVTETPPSPVGRLVLWSIMLLLVFGLTWSIFGHVDEVAIATGKIIPNGQVKIVQSESKGIVKSIYIKEGQMVKKGDLLIELDQTISAADLTQIKKEIAYYQLEIDRLLAEQAGGGFYPKAAPDLDPKDLEFQMRLYQTRMSEYQTKTAAASASLNQQNAALGIAQANRIKYQQQLGIAADKESRIESLVGENAISLFVLLDHRAKRLELEQSLQAQEAEIARAQAAIAQSQQIVENVTAERDREIATLMVEARKKLATYQEELKKADEKNRLAKIVAPADGRVNQLSVHTVGGVVTEAQALLTVVPEDVTMEVEAWAANKDIGFIQVGQKAEVKVETFNFQKYGIVDAEVVEISPDAVEDPKDKSLRYRIVLNMDKDSMFVNARRVPLAPGMSVSAEIKIKQKRIIEFFLDPFRQYKSEALRER